MKYYSLMLSVLLLTACTNIAIVPTIDNRHHSEIQIINKNESETKLFFSDGITDAKINYKQMNDRLINKMHQAYSGLRSSAQMELHLSSIICSGSFVGTCTIVVQLTINDKQYIFTSDSHSGYIGKVLQLVWLAMDDVVIQIINNQEINNHLLH